MAIKDLFSKQKEQSIEFRGANQKSLDEFRQDIESPEEIKQIRIEDGLVIPDLNYASASNFAKYGSAKKYYEDSIKRIYSQYPYDGSSAEKIAFRNEITQLERYILDNEYPRSTGFAEFGKAGWGSYDGDSSLGFSKTTLPEYITAYGYKTNQVWDADSKQQQSFRLDFTQGVTVEFWMKKNGFVAPSSPVNSAEAIIDIRDPSLASSSFSVFVNGTTTSTIYTVFNTPTANATFFMSFDTGLANIADSEWHHYAISYHVSGTKYYADLYVDGEYADSDNNGTTIVALTGSLKATIGALGGDYYNEDSNIPAGYGKLSGSLDEIRFWQETRNAQQIGRNYFTVVNGGGNTDSSKVNDDNTLKLTAYYKFNEGVTGNATTDAVVLDYSGRLVNGAWTGYSSNSRDTGSAITISGVGTETGDPIIYLTHPSVATLSSNLEASGTQYDASNVGNLQNSIPLWMLDEDNESGGELKNLLQIIGSYFDTLHLQTSQITKYRHPDYQDNSNVSANPYNGRLLTSLGFDTPEIFIDKNVLESIANQDDKRKFEDKLNEIKNLIYKNIYNNLTHINKSKGTVKAIRNLLRCYGIDDDLFNFNVYADQAEYVLKDDYKNSSIKFDSLDLTPFANTQNSEGVIYNFAESGNSNSSPYISGSTYDQLGFTVEVNTIFPKTPPNYQDSVNLTEPAIVTASVFGLREANYTSDTTVTAPDYADVSVRLIKVDNTAKFQLSSSIGSGFVLETDRFYDVYENSRWSLSVRLKYNSEEFKTISGKDYTLEFSGYNYEQDILQNSFALTSSIASVDGALFVQSDKRVYVGAERTNITGALTHRSNMKLLSALAWADYVEDDELQAHARDVTSFGRKEPYDNTFTFTSNNFDEIYIPKFDSLALNWGFDVVTSSNGSGKFVVPDLSSGSINLVSKYGDYSKIVGIQNTAQGSEFPNSSDVKDIQYLNIMTQQIPENLNTDNMIQILESDDDLFFLDNRPVKYFFSLEASMYDTISREMLKTFAGVLDYGSMIGSPIVDYQVENKDLRIARENFFSRVENQPDLEKYVSLYKFLDSAIEGVLFNLMPASANASERVRTVIESHILERASQRKVLIPNAKSTTDKDGNKPVETPELGPLKLPQDESDYDFGPRKDLTDRTVDIRIGSDIRVEKRDFRVFRVPLTQRAETKVRDWLDSYSNKRFAQSNDSTGTSAWYAVMAERTEGGLVAPTDGDKATRRSLFRTRKQQKILEAGGVTKAQGDVQPIALYSTQRLNQGGNLIIPLIQPEEVGNIVLLTKKDQLIVAEDLIKNFVDFDLSIQDNTSGNELRDPNKLPIRFTVSGSSDFFGVLSGSLQGHHLDTYYGNDFQNPLQGPFTEQHVGGLKHRHTEIGQSLDRPELYKIDTRGSSDDKVRIYNPRFNPDTNTYDFNIPRVKFSRDELVKRAYNIKNIKTTVGSQHLGNFTQNYEVVSTNGRKENNFAFVQQGGFNITGSESTAVSGVIDFTLPNRALSDGTYNKTVIVNRFSSPGEVATLSEGYLDVEAAEYSPYNALPFRNREAVDNLNLFNQIPSAFGGYESGSTVTASYHKVQRNRVNRLKNALGGTLYTGSSFDNGFVINNIPRKDFGYWWISSSADPSSSMDGLYGFASSSDGITFYSSSIRDFESAVDYVINFVGISTPGEFAQFAGYHYEITDDQNLLTTPVNYLNSPSLADNIDVYFLNINGPYHYPSWKQIRTGEHPVARFLNKNSYIISQTDGDNLRIKHSPLSSRFKPVIHNVTSREVIGGEPVERDLILAYTFGNNYDFYGNYYDYTNNRLDNPFREKNFDIVDKGESLLYNISRLYTKGVSVLRSNSLLYREKIYPKETNTYLSKTRDRSRFVFKWRDNLDDRLNETTGSQNELNYSLWPMDTNGSDYGELLNNLSGSNPRLAPRFGRYNLSGSSGYTYLTASAPYNSVQFGTADSAGQGAFEDSYSEWNHQLRLIAKDQSILPEYRISEHISGIIDSGYNISNDSFQALSLTGSQATGTNARFLEDYCHSEDIPAIEILKETQDRDADRISINITAAKKLLPYDGFYPVQRTLQLSTMFSQSIAPNVTLTGTEATFQTLNNAIFSRLTYGSIRAGLATDTAIWQSGSIINPSDPGEVNTGSGVEWSRLPFETIVNPANYLNTNSDIIENDVENLINSTASVGFINNNYSLAASNFYAGVVSTFIQNKALATIKSKPETEWAFTDSGIHNYQMDIVIAKDNNFSNHDDPAANGYPYITHGCFYQPLSSSDGLFTPGDSLNTAYSSYNANVPPNASWTYNEAFVTLNFDYNSFKSTVTDRDPTLNDVLFYSTKTFKNRQFANDSTVEINGYASSSNTNSSPFMTVEAGVDLFNYDSQTGQWIINTKCEFPVHNFVDNGAGEPVAALYPDGTEDNQIGEAGDCNRGVWHQFSSNTNSGLKLLVRGPDTTTNRTTGSLAAACGFETEQKVVSQLADSTMLKEYVVVVPFVTNECDEETLFHYPMGEFERAYSKIGEDRESSLTKMLSTMREVILPVKFNFMDKRVAAGKRLEQDEYGPVLPPFAMYIFEFNQELNQSDLSRWWQGVLPEVGSKLSLENFSISHKIENGEIISPAVLNNDLFKGKLPKNLRFKVFKAKHRGNLNYSEMKNKSIYGTEPNNLVFGYNYPHDFYSLVETAKVELGIIYEGDEG